MRALIRTVPDFPSPGIQFRDISTLLADRAGFAATIDALAGLVKGESFAAVAGIEARGFVFGAALAMRLDAGFIPLRKPGKLPVATIGEDYALEYGSARLECDPTVVPESGNILLVDDLIATGGTARAGASLLRRAGGKCTRAVFVIDLPDLGGADALMGDGVEVSALLAYSGH